VTSRFRAAGCLPFEIVNEKRSQGDRLQVAHKWFSKDTSGGE
jgi:hypothetical protein